MPYLEASNGLLHYQKIGTGPKLMLALHGFGKESTYFKSFASILGNSYTIYALDLPFHGLTSWKGETFSQTDVAEWVTSILVSEGQLKCTLLGHSLGGRIWLACLPKLKSKIESLFLLAPDGVSTKGMSLPDLIPFWCRKSVAKTLQEPAWLLKLASWLYQSRLLSSFAYKYLKYHFRTTERQQSLLQTWISLSHFRINLSRIAKSLTGSQELNLIAFIGKEDPLIKVDHFKAKAGALPQVEVKIISGGHQLISEKATKEISQHLALTY